jgi:hypothetical protein
MIRFVLKLALLLSIALATVHCGGPGSREESLRVRLYNYSAAIRWNEIERAAEFVDPAVLAEHPIGPADIERWHEVQVSRYVEGIQGMDAQGVVLQAVEIELIDRATQRVRSITDTQRWRYDEDTKIWWLESGLPVLDPAPR